MIEVLLCCEVPTFESIGSPSALIKVRVAAGVSAITMVCAEALVVFPVRSASNHALNDGSYTASHTIPSSGVVTVATRAIGAVGWFCITETASDAGRYAIGNR